LSYLNFLAEENIGINKFVSMGNKLNVDENELLGYLIQDEGTKIILVYLEGFKDARRFIEVASTSTNRSWSTSPIVLSSASIAHSHTTPCLRTTCCGLCLEQAGCIRLNTMDDSMDYSSRRTTPLRGTACGYLQVRRPRRHRCRCLRSLRFTLPRFPEELLRKVEAVSGPCDPLAESWTSGLFELEFYAFIVEEMLKRDEVDASSLPMGIEANWSRKRPEH